MRNAAMQIAMVFYFIYFTYVSGWHNYAYYCIFKINLSWEHRPPLWNIL